MALFEALVGLLLVSALLLQLSRRLKAPYPTMLALAGVAAAAFPWAPQVSIDPHLALALFVAPAILSMAYDTSPHDLRRNWLSLTALALFAVVLTAAAVAWAGWALAGLPIAAAIALGAIVAPPDTAAAGAVLANLGLPRRMMTILQGESLLNDAVALLIFGSAVAMASGGESPLAVMPRLLLAVPGGLALGIAAGLLFVRLWHLWAGTLSSTILEFTSTFGIWLLAERLHVSPVLAVVSYAMLVARHAPSSQPPRDRILSFSVWDATVFVLNVLAFMLMGLQARAIVQRLEGADLWHSLGFAGLVFLIVVGVRIAWVMLYGVIAARIAPRLPDAVPTAPSPHLRLLVAWCGMRGILTLATALSLPNDFPGRDVIVLSAFTVILGTLIIQGGTIGPLIHWLKLPPDKTLDRDLAAARKLLAAAGAEALERHAPDGNAQAVADERAARPEMPVVEERTVPPDDAAEATTVSGVPLDDSHLAIVNAQRTTLNALYRNGTVAGDVFRVLQEELDWRELSITPRRDREITEV
jgi:CPA1 family monovalent cation:H+ antiporter